MLNPIYVAFLYTGWWPPATNYLEFDHSSRLEVATFPLVSHGAFLNSCFTFILFSMRSLLMALFYDPKCCVMLRAPVKVKVHELLQEEQEEEEGQEEQEEDDEDEDDDGEEVDEMDEKEKNQAHDQLPKKAEEKAESDGE